jgi:UDP-N-acetylmuramate--alanine ligase
LKKENDWRAGDIKLVHGAYSEFDVYKNNEKLGRVTLSIPGEHNVYNALAAFASADFLGADINKAFEIVGRFSGAGRRFEKLAEIGGITIIDDYAHHPTELEATLKTAKELDFNHVIAVFQPFTYSRTYKLLDDFARVLKIPDKVIMTEIMGSREKKYLQYPYFGFSRKDTGQRMVQNF